MERDSAICFANQLRDARGNALRDSEAFDEIIHVVERLGSYCMCAIENLGEYKPKLVELARLSALAIDVPAIHPVFHVSFPRLYDLVQYARNAALHQGAVARRLTGHAIQLTLVLEDALRQGFSDMTVGDYMVRNVICAEEWQPISFIRQQMLANSFTFMPVKIEKHWRLISDLEVARFLGTDGRQRNNLLAKTLKESGIKLNPTIPCTPRTALSDALKRLVDEKLPLVVCVDTSAESPIAGILTAFDLL